VPSASRADRRLLLIQAARAAGILVEVTPEQALVCSGLWDAAQRERLRARRFRPAPMPLAVPGLLPPQRGRELPPVQSWIEFRPHIGSRPEVFQVVAFVPNGVSIDTVLNPQQARILKDGVRLRCFHGDRVVLGQPGGMHLIASLRTALAGAVAARATVISDPTTACASRLVSHLEPGSAVAWIWHSSFGPSRRDGVVVAYIPGGRRLSDVAPDVPASCRLRPLSNQDRYLVRVDRHPFYLTPPAFAVERPHVEAKCLPVP
jgi:hypothetical protein